MPSNTKTVKRTAGENKMVSPSTISLARDLEALCKPYVDAFFADLAQHPSRVPRASLQTRECTNYAAAAGAGGHSSEALQKLVHTDSTEALLAAPEALLRECSHLIERATRSHEASSTVAAPPRRSAAELGAENVYLRALLTRLLQQSSPPKETVAEVQEIAPPVQLSPRPAAQPTSPESATHVEGSSSRRSPSAACPDQVDHAHLSADALHRAFAARKTAFVEARETSPATTHQVGELQEQIELLREAVRELSQQTSVARGYSASPLPAETRAAPFTVRAVSPSPRCATPTCTTDVPTLHRIILHQQQAIRTLQLEMEEVELAKVQIEQLLHLHEAAATASAANVNPTMRAEEEEDTPCLADTTHWRSTCHTEDGALDETLMPFSPLQASAPTATGDASTAAAEDMYKMDFDAAAEMNKEKRRAATVGGARRTTWFGSAVSVEDAIQLTRGPADCDGEDSDSGEEDEEEVDMGDEAPSSGMRTPLPRRTVVLRPLQQRYSSTTGDSSSMTGGAMDESPVMRPTKVSFGTVSNRRTSAMGSFGGI